MLSSAATFGAEVRIERSEHGAIVTVDDGPFAEYRVHSGHQPVIWPIVGPGGQAMTRQYPLGPLLPGEKDDHPHHRSLWFNHGLVNDLDFWKEPNLEESGGKDNQIVHVEFSEVGAADGTARLVARNDWTSDGKKVCEDVRTVEFGVGEDGRWIDFQVELKASEGELTLGDTKEGSFGVRVPGTMSVDEKLGGRILNSRGLENEAAWGREAEWVDYRGPVDGKLEGITIFSLPDSFRPACRWHVRTYGLFAANPFGQHDFPPGDAPQGAVVIPHGESIRLHYRVLFTSGERTAEQLQALYDEFSNPDKRPSGIE